MSTMLFLYSLVFSNHFIEKILLCRKLMIIRDTLILFQEMLRRIKRNGISFSFDFHSKNILSEPIFVDSNS